jgi:hypothetical protein
MKTVKTPKTAPKTSTIVNTPPPGAVALTGPNSVASRAADRARMVGTPHIPTKVAAEVKAPRGLPAMPKGSNKVQDPTPLPMPVKTDRTATSTGQNVGTGNASAAVFPAFCTVGATVYTVVHGEDAVPAVPGRVFVSKVKILSKGPDGLITDDGRFATETIWGIVGKTEDVFPGTEAGLAGARERAALLAPGAEALMFWRGYRTAIVAGLANTRDEARLRAGLSQLNPSERGDLARLVGEKRNASEDQIVAAWGKVDTGSDVSKATRLAASDVVQAFKDRFPTLAADIRERGSMAVLGVPGWRGAEAKATPTAKETPAKGVKTPKKAKAA